MKLSNKIKRTEGLILALCMIISILGLSGCSKKTATSNDDSISNNQNNLSQEEIDKIKSTALGNEETITVEQLKLKYAVGDKIEGDDYIRPFYNVNQDTRFTFHFNSTMEPYKAISVHTDPSCNIESTVYQINDGYLTDNGVDVVVKPGKPILNTSDRKSGELDNYNWGNAPIYYICIKYNMYSSEIEKLDNPIIIPFTIRSEISTPNLEYSIDNDGTFRLNWKPVANAVKYNIYYANAVRSNAEDFTRSECAYIGDHLKLLTTVSGDTTTFTDFSLDGKDGCNEYDGYTIQQNMSNQDTYYITAVDSDGNESQFSMAVEAWKHADQLPFSFDSSDVFITNSEYKIDNLPETVFVTMADKSQATFPIEYRRLSTNIEQDTARYMYSIIGTRLTGEVLGDVAYKVDGKYLDEIKSSFKIDTSIYKPENNIDIVPSNDIITVSGYSQDDLHLSDYTDRGDINKFKYDRDEILARADAEAARIVTDGIYTTNPDEIFTTTYDFEYTPEKNKTDTGENETIDNMDNAADSSDSPLADGSDSSASDGSDSSASDSSNNKDNITDNTDNNLDNTEDTDNKNTDSTDSLTNLDETLDEELITSDNLVQQQIENVKEEIIEANSQELKTGKYPIFADSAEEEYIANQIINCETEISLSAFPKLQNCEYLIDVIYKVHFQNPYDMGLNGFTYDPSTQILNIKYSEDKESMQRKQKEIAEKASVISNSIIKTGMSNEDKILAIWNYLENNTLYNNDALENAANNNFVLEDNQYIDSFTTYGIICKDSGVCQSYAYAFKLLCSMNDVKCNVLTGYLNKTLPHAWNIIELGDKWYWLDATNNKQVTGIPYMLYQSSYDFATKIDYVLDNNYEIDSNLDYITYTDSLRDWYATHDLMAGDADDTAEKIKAQIDSGNDQIFIKVDSGIQIDGQYITNVGGRLLSIATDTDIANYKIGYAMGYIYVIK